MVDVRVEQVIVDFFVELFLSQLLLNVLGFGSKGFSDLLEKSKAPGHQRCKGFVTWIKWMFLFSCHSNL